MPYLVPLRVVEGWLVDDVPYGDLTTLSLGIGGLEGVAEVFVREKCVVAGTEEAGRVYELAGARVDYLKGSGSKASPGEVVLRASGKALSLHTAWRVAQTAISFASGVATKTRRLVTLARSANPGVMVVTTRKTPPGVRALYFKAVMAGGGYIHRYGLSETILVFSNHASFLGGLEEALRALSEVRRSQPTRKVGIEVGSLEEAVKAARAGIEFIQLEKLRPSEVREAVRAVREVSPTAVVAVAGGIDEGNIREYADAGVDVIVTSAPYSAKPIDVGTRIAPRGNP